MNINKHKYFLLQLLKDIYSDTALAPCLGFKGGTALMFFHDLPRFSVDLDFNLLNKSKEKEVYEKVRNILLGHGKVFDEAMKFYGPLIVLDYGVGERKLKIEISNRENNDNYEIRNLLGVDMKVMVMPDMFAHKLCALLGRNDLKNRDIFDCWFFLQKKTPVNKHIVEANTKMPLSDYLQKCIDYLEKMSDNRILNGIGDLADDEMKMFIRKKLRLETIFLLRFFKEFPII